MLGLPSTAYFGWNAYVLSVMVVCASSDYKHYDYSQLLVYSARLSVRIGRSGTTVNPALPT